jgi:hypothetical protein
VLTVDPMMPKVSLCRSPSRPTTRVVGGYAGLDRDWQTDRIDGINCSFRHEYRMAEIKPLSGNSFGRLLSSSVSGAGIERNRRFSAQSRSRTMGYQREPAGMSALQVHRV